MGWAASENILVPTHCLSKDDLIGANTDGKIKVFSLALPGPYQVGDHRHQQMDELYTLKVALQKVVDSGQVVCFP